MKALALLFASVLLLAAANPQLQQVHTVYLLTMSNSMDQYLANRLTTEGVLQVVTDPDKADAVLTDHVGVGFEDRLKQLYPPPAPPPPPPQDSDKEKDKDKDKDKDKSRNDLAAALESSGASHPPSGSRPARGNFFLVDRRSRQVVWSIYSRPKDTGANELSKTANRVVEQLKKDLEGKSPAAP
jgi:hypothetical protein